VAGIGFDLQRLAREGGVLRPVASAGHGAVVAAGPWLLTVLAMALIQRGLPRSGQAAYDLQALIIYNFSISLTVTAPVVTAALRLAADDLYLKRFERLRSAFLAALAGSIGATMIAVATVFALGFGWRGWELMAAVASAGAIGAIWPATAFCAATRDFGSVTLAFAAGLALAVAATLSSANAGLPPSIQALLFASGLWLTAIWLSSRILLAFPDSAPSLTEPLDRLLGAARAHPAVVVGSLLAVCAIWADSWIMWFGPAGLAVPSGLPTAPFYDSAMFVARLAMLPGLVLFLTTVDTGVFTAVRGFLAVIEGHGTLIRIEASGRALAQQTHALLVRLMLVQAAVCVLAVALAPAIVGPAGLLFQQLGILRFGVAASLFHVLFFAATTLLVLLGRERAFLLAQALFLLLNAVLTLLTLALGRDLFGAGYLLAAILASIAALLMLERALGLIVPLTFEAALRQSRRPAASPTPTPFTTLRRRLARLAPQATRRLDP